MTNKKLDMTVMQAPFGPLYLYADTSHLWTVSFCESTTIIPQSNPKNLILKETCAQLNDYFSGQRFEFDIPMKLQGTNFQQSVWQQLQAIEYGTTNSYGQVAAAIQNPKAVRAVGMANNKNPIVIIVPCHRVIGAGGQLVGYGGGLSVKEWLLDHEQNHCR